MNSFSYHYDLRPVFDDFLTMSMCAVTQIPSEGKSHYESLYMDTIAKYANDELRHQFPKLFACLVLEMEERVKDTKGNDILGEYYELNFCRKNSGQFFTPMHVCHLMARSICGDSKDIEEPKRVLDPCCGSGRTLLAGAHCMGRGHEFYGIDIDHTCVKMTALNLFLNGIFHSEVMWADALSPGDFQMSYVISFLPLGIFRVEVKEQSKLWRMYRNSFPLKQSESKVEVTLPSEDSNQIEQGLQLQLFLKQPSKVAFYISRGVLIYENFSSLQNEFVTRYTGCKFIF